MKTYFKPVLIASVVGLAIGMSACSEARTADKNAADQVSAAAAPAAAPIAAANWDIQAGRSHIRFTAKQEGSPFSGEFQAFSGIINFDPAAPQNGSVKITVPLKSVDAGSNDRNSTLPGKVWFSAKAFPEAVYRSSEISKDGDGYIAKGELTLKGLSVPLDIPFNLDIKGDTAVMTGAVEMDRTQWKVGAAPWDTDEWVSKSVTLDLHVTAKKLN